MHDFSPVVHKGSGTRIRVTCLPRDVKEGGTPEIVSAQKGEITDLVILRTVLGIPRMAFIGYKLLPPAATKAIKTSTTVRFSKTAGYKSNLLARQNFVRAQVRRHC